MPEIRSSGTIRFGVFEADVRSGELRRNGDRIRLHRQPFQLLVALIEHPGEVVTREELKRQLWGDQTYVDFDVGLNSAVKKLREALGDSAEVPRFIETIPRIGYRFIGTVEGEPRVSRWRRYATVAAVALIAAIAVAITFAVRTPKPVRSIAVLPFENLSGDPAQDYIAEGMTDAITTNLAEIGALRVISRTSAARYRKTQKELPQIAKELNVDAIVEGSVARSAGRVRVDAQLIEAATDRHLWARTYEQNASDAVLVETEIAAAVADAVQVQLSPQERTRLVRKQTTDAEAYELYLRGRFFLDKWTDASCRKSAVYFQQAIGKDRQYALAYAGLAEALLLREDLSPRDHMVQSQSIARTALRMDDALPEAHNILGMTLFLYDWNFPEAEKEFRRALALNPNYAMAHQFYGQLQKAMGRPDWKAEVERAREIDPLNILIAGAGRYRNRPDLAIRTMQEKLEREPGVPNLYEQLGDIYWRIGKYDESIRAYRTAYDLSAGLTRYLGFIGYVDAIAGRRDDARAMLEQMRQLSAQRYVSPYHVAIVYAGLRENDAAFDWLNKALADRSTSLVFLKWDDRMAGLRSDPRYADMLRRVGLPQ